MYLVVRITAGLFLDFNKYEYICQLADDDEVSHWSSIKYLSNTSVMYPLVTISSLRRTSNRTFHIFSHFFAAAHCVLVRSSTALSYCHYYIALQAQSAQPANVRHDAPTVGPGCPKWAPSDPIYYVFIIMAHWYRTKRSFCFACPAVGSVALRLEVVAQCVLVFWSDRVFRAARFAAAVHTHVCAASSCINMDAFEIYFSKHFEGMGWGEKRLFSLRFEYFIKNPSLTPFEGEIIDAMQRGRGQLNIF